MQARGGGAGSKIFDPGFAAEGEAVSLEDAQLLTEGKDLKAEVVARTEECAEAGEILSLWEGTSISSAGKV